MDTKELKALKDLHPEIATLAEKKECLWINPSIKSEMSLNVENSFDLEDIIEASERLERFAPYIERVFPETSHNKGIIESDLVEIPRMKSKLQDMWQSEIRGHLFLKKDSHLPISGSVKARGGIYEVLKFAEKIALDKGLINIDDDYSVMADKKFKEVFSGYSVAVGSTGNLGLSIGIISAELGFKVTVHMSSDARQWKKDLLRAKGVTVVEYDEDYQTAVAQGRLAAKGDPHCHFVDDEGSQDLFLGYAVAALRLKKQLKDLNIAYSDKKPLIVYIPCGVGGAPGGITFGLKKILGENVHIIFMEPVQAPCMALGMISGLNDKISVFDIGLDCKTAADGLAVGRASNLVGNIMKYILDGIYTMNDDKLYEYLSMLADSENVYVEPSACGGFEGPLVLSDSSEYMEYIGRDAFDNANHIVWATGGNMVPEDEMKRYYEKGKKLLQCQLKL